MGSREGDDDEPSDFERAMADAVPLAGRDKLSGPPPGRIRPPARAEVEEPIAFEIERHDERIEGRAPGIDLHQLQRLRSGRIEIDARIDLHGVGAAAAELALRDALAAALDAEHRCLLVVHGRGLHSAGAPVIKRALPDWLAAPPHGTQVLAFASALPADGGSGATYVLLRRRR